VTGVNGVGADASLAFLPTGEEESRMTQMRENLSLFSFWGLIFALTADFVVVYAYKNRTAIGGKYDIVDDLRRHSVAVYLGAETSLDISHKLRDAGDEIERLRGMNFVLFWLIIAMNAVVIGLLLVGYRTF
jgi:hypothetical protein